MPQSMEESPYHDSYKKILTSIDQDVDNGGNPIEVAKKIHQIIQTKNPKVHYQVGSFIQRFSIVLKRIIPDKWYEMLLLKYSQN